MPGSSTRSRTRTCSGWVSRSPTRRRSACAWTTTCRSSCSTSSRPGALPAPSQVRRSARSSQPTPDPGEGAHVIDDELLEAEEKMDKAVAVAKDDFGAIRTGRAHPGMFAKIVVDYYG